MDPIGSERGSGDGGRRLEAIAASGDWTRTTVDAERAVTGAAAAVAEPRGWAIWVGSDRPPGGFDRWSVPGGQATAAERARERPGAVVGTLFPTGVEATTTHPDAGDQDE